MSDTDLILRRTLPCTAQAAFRCWTEAGLLQQFFAPAPGKTIAAVIDPVPGGRFFTHMRFAEHGDITGEGCILHVEPGRRLVFTDALREGWRPNAAGFFSADIRFTPMPDGHCTYEVIARHHDAETAARHAAMGFEPGWGQVAEQLGQLAATLGE